MSGLSGYIVVAETIVGELSDSGAHIGGDISVESTLAGAFSNVMKTFPGPYEYTPIQGTQIVPIGNQMAAEDIIINEIPHNYGLITWDGSVLTVS